LIRHLDVVPALAALQVLKYVINQARPSSRKADPGMPSAHGNSLGFLVSERVQQQ
jgi:dolichyldiphosphatase